jgi:hypothetical protein
MVRDDKKEDPHPVVMLNLVLNSIQYRFSIWLIFFLPLADTPFIPAPAYRRQAQGGVFRCDLNNFTPLRNFSYPNKPNFFPSLVKKRKKGYNEK